MKSYLISSDELSDSHYLEFDTFFVIATFNVLKEWWRKGFWRNQPYGSRVNPSYRPTWIEPTWCQPGE